MIETLKDLLQAEYLLPFWFWLLVPCAVLAFTGMLKGRGILVSVLRLAFFALLIAAIADPVKEQRSEKQELAAVLDVSASVLPAAQNAMLEKLNEFASADRTVTIFPFAKALSRNGRTLKDGDTAMRSEFDADAAKLDQGETNIGGAIDGVLSRSESSSVLLLTDGFENNGNALQAARVAAQQGARIFPIIPDEAVFSRERVRISSLYAPLTAHAGDLLEVRSTIENTFEKDASGKLEIYLDSEKLFSQSITIPGRQEKLISIKSAPAQGGLHQVRAVFRPDRLSGHEAVSNNIESHRWVSVKEKSKILLLSGTHDDERILKQVISQKGYSLEDVVADGSKNIPESFDGYSSVIFNNVAKRQVGDRFLTALEAFVQGGGGLLLVGGERSFGLGGYVDSKLDQISPLKFVPPQTEKRRLTNAVALVIDKSGSMAEEGKIDAAKMAALASIQSLKDEDFVSVIGFDAGPFVIIDVQPVAQAKRDAEYRLRNLTAAGKTNLLPALATARQRLQKAGASRKHIIVLSDGKFPLSSEAYIAEINNLRNEGITVSAVALGVEADIPFMKILSKYGKGAFYHTLDARQLPRIFIEDIKVASGEKTLQEGAEFPVGVAPGGVRSTTIDEFPPVRGFVETLPKKGADLELITRKEDQPYPLLASWRYGTGKVIAFASDANGRWSMRWVPWRGFAQFWSELIEGVKDRSESKTGDVDFDLRYSVERKTIVFDLAVFDPKLATEAPPRITADVIEPGGEQQQLVFQATKKGRFEARIDNGRPGDYKLQIAYGKLKFPPLAPVLGGELFGENPGQGINVSLLESIAYASGGRINPRPDDVRGIPRVTADRKHLFIPLALIGFLLLLAEAFTREGAWRTLGGFFGGLFGRKRRIATVTPIPPRRPRTSQRKTEKKKAA